jgi:hypothetical protein
VTLRDKRQRKTAAMCIDKYKGTIQTKECLKRRKSQKGSSYAEVKRKRVSDRLSLSVLMHRSSKLLFISLSLLCPALLAPLTKVSPNILSDMAVIFPNKREKKWVA